MSKLGSCVVRIVYKKDLILERIFVFLREWGLLVMKQKGLK